MVVAKNKRNVSKKAYNPPPGREKKQPKPDNKSSSRPKKLTAQEQIFIDQYLISLKPEEAALIAEYAATTSHTKAYLWVSNSKNNPKPYIYKIIQKKLTKLSEDAGVTAKMIVEEFKKIGFANIKDLIKLGNKIKDVSQLPSEVAAVVESISTTKAGGVKIAMHSKIKALENLGKIKGIYERDNRQKAENLADFLKEMKE